MSTPASYPEGETTTEQVELELVVNAEGRVTEVRAISGPGRFRERAEAASQRWHFDPATREGVPVTARVRFVLTFEPPRPSSSAETNEETPPASSAHQTTSPNLEAQRGEHGKGAREESPEQEILVVGERQTLRTRLSRVDVRELPGAFGDAYRAIEVLPGVVPIASGVPYFYVRGAPPGNIGYFFDDIPVPLLYHFAAGPAVLHPAFVGNVDLYPGAYPARYGRFAGGIVAGEIAAPSYRVRGEASIRIVDSGAMLELPFADGRGSAMLAGRFSYTAALLSLISPDVNVGYWDYQGRVRYALTSRDSVEVLGFGSRDVVTEQERAFGRETTRTLVNLGFHRVALRWERALPRGRLRTGLLLGLDKTYAGDEGEIELTSRMIGARAEYERAVSESTSWRAGVDVLTQSYSQQLAIDVSEGSASAPSPADSSDAARFGFAQEHTDYVATLFAELTLNPTRNIQVVAGLRGDTFASEGQWRLGIDPRISARFTLGHGWTMKHGLGVAHQPPSFIAAIPGASPSLTGKLQRTIQHSVGVERALPAGIRASVTLFQNLFFDMTDYIGLVQQQTTVDREDNLRMGGRGFGAELLLQRSLAHSIGGFLSYTVLRSERYSGEFSGPTTTDRTHVLNLALSYDLGKNWRFGNRFMFYSGVPARVAYLEAARHPPRAPGFYRLDIRLQKRFWYGPERYWGLVLEVLNTTLHRETLDRSCNAFDCRDNPFGPVTIPSVGVEGAF
ncbi:MAG TPA: TonB-dependent receptor [Polyangiaceae bacterium]|nr:TonB-dependent receptor [Polyangiaceae bacterium]